MNDEDDLFRGNFSIPEHGFQWSKDFKPYKKIKEEDPDQAKTIRDLFTPLEPTTSPPFSGIITEKPIRFSALETNSYVNQDQAEKDSLYLVENWVGDSLKYSVEPFAFEEKEVFKKKLKRKDSLLFKDFINLTDNPEAILSFANQYGWLGLKEPGKTTEGVCLGESFRNWDIERRELKMAFQVWEWIQNKATGKLKEHIIRDKGEVSFQYYVIGEDEITGDEEKAWREAYSRKEVVLFECYTSLLGGKEAFRIFNDPNDCILPAKYFLATLTASKLQSNLIAIPLVTQEDNFKFHLRATTLLQTLWFQFFRFLTGDVKFRRCEICGDLMDVTNYRENKRVHDDCSRKIRNQRYWQKQKRKRQNSTDRDLKK
jgi:hypothetical protein